MINRIKENFSNLYHEISNDSDDVDIVYNIPSVFLSSSKNTCKNVFYDMLCTSRKKDIDSGFTSFGPHRDDFSFLLNGRSARNYCSQGQSRSLVLSLKFASGISLENSLEDSIVYLIDDNFSELDSFRTDQLFRLLKKRGQVFMATPEGKHVNYQDTFCIQISS